MLFVSLCCLHMRLASKYVHCPSRAADIYVYTYIPLCITNVISVTLNLIMCIIYFKVLYTQVKLMYWLNVTVFVNNSINISLHV
jgi:uncharacterized protein with PQ loop repeat